MELFDPQLNDWLLNKFFIYKKLRNLDQAYYSEKYNLYVITRYKDVLYILNNPEIFSSSKGNLLLEDSSRFGNTLGASDNPIHNEYKDMVKNAYSKDNIKRVSKLFSEKAKEYFDNKKELNISEITEELSAWVGAEIMNFPLYKPYIKDIIIESQKHSPFSVSKDHVENYEEKYNLILSKYKKLVKTIRNRIPATGPGIYKEYIENSLKKTYTNDDSSLYLGGPMLSGTGSLIAALQFLTLDLYRENQLDLLISDRSLIQLAVNESLRFSTSTGRFLRTAIKECNIHGIQLNPGDRVAVCLDSANRDPDKFTDPDKFDIFRDNSSHLAWGHGVHSCIALAISKAIMTSYIEILLDKVGKYEILTKNDDLEYKISGSGTTDIIKNIIIKKH